MKPLAYNTMSVILQGAAKEIIKENDELLEMVKAMKKQMHQ